VFEIMINFAKKITKILVYIPCVPIYLLSCIVPRKNNIWVFGAWFGNKFADNSKYLFMYINNNQPHIRPIWLSKNNQVLQELKENGYECYHAFSFKGCYFSLLAKVAIVSTGSRDVNRFLIGGAKIIQLWHGTPLKKIGFDDKITFLKNQDKILCRFYTYIGKSILPALKEKCDLYIASSSEVRIKMGTAFEVKSEKILVTGYPRNDILFEDELNYYPNDSNYLNRITSEYGCKYIFIYLPTHRSEGRKDANLLEPYGFDTISMQKLLEDLDAILIIKAHFYNSKICWQDDLVNRIIIPSDNDIPDIYPILKRSDVLITDYSSVYFDFLLLNRPIIFTPFDLKEYIEEDRELYYDYNSITPGPKASDWKEVMQFMKMSIKNPNRHQTERIKINECFNKYMDNNNSERVYQQIIKLLNQVGKR